MAEDRAEDRTQYYFEGRLIWENPAEVGFFGIRLRKELLEERIIARISARADDMMAIRHRWAVPPDKRSRFIQDWKDLTTLSKSPDATLHDCGDGNFVALAVWSCREEWEIWSREIQLCPLRATDHLYLVREAKELSMSKLDKYRAELPPPVASLQKERGSK